MKGHGLLMLVILALPLTAGQFKRSLGRGESLQVKLPSLPVVRIGRATLAIEVKDATGGASSQASYSAAAGAQSSGPVSGASGSTAISTVPANELQAALDRVFREAFTLVQANGEALLRVAVTHYGPAESTIQTVQQKTRVPAVNPDGSRAIDPQTGQPMTVEQQVPVEQWTARGQIALRVEVVDSTGVLIDAFAPQAAVKAAQVISLNGQDRVDRTQLPTSEQVLAKLIGDIVAQFQSRYCPPAQEIEIPLAVDEELRAGNQLARKGAYAEAAKSWQEAAIKKYESDRTHNLGSVYEAQAYEMLLKQQELDKIVPYLQRASKQYGEAAAADPEEKFLTRAVERVAKSLQVIEAFRELERKRQSALTAKAAPSPWPPGGQSWGAAATAAAATGAQTIWAQAATGAGQAASGAVQTADSAAVQQGGWPPIGSQSGNQNPSGGSTATQPQAIDSVSQEALAQALNDPRPDSTQEADFRKLVRLRVRSGAGPVPDAVREQLESTGPLAYALTQLQAKRVVHQEMKFWSAVQPKVQIYRDSLKAFAADGRITPEERSALRTLSGNLGLGEAEVRELESAVKVVE